MNWPPRSFATACLVLLACAGGLGGCASLPAYDSKTDELLTALQTDTDTYIGQLKSGYDATTADNKACAYSSNLKTVQALETSLGVLSTRLDALYDNQSSQKTFGDVKAAYSGFFAAQQAAEKVRADHCILPVLLATDQTALDSAVGALLKLELMKKGGA